MPKARAALVLALVVLAAASATAGDVESSSPLQDKSNLDVTKFMELISSFPNMLKGDDRVDTTLESLATPAVELENTFLDKDESGRLNDAPTIDQRQNQEALDAFRGFVSPSVMRDIKKVYFFGDLHGDLLAFDAVVKLIDITKQDRPSTLIVSTGDFMDRGPDDMTIWKAFWNIRLQGYKLVLVNGNHESMVAGGAWRYRDIGVVVRRGLQICQENEGGSEPNPDLTVNDCAEYVGRAIREDKDSVLNCDGAFNKFVRDVMSPVALLTHPSHKERVVISHGGVSPAFAEEFTRRHLGERPSVEGFVQKISGMYRAAMLEDCKRNEENVNAFKPLTTGGRYSHFVGKGWMKSLEGSLSAGADDIFNKEAVGETIIDNGRINDPTWDRSFQSTAEWSNVEGSISSNNEFFKLFAENFRQVVGHTPRADVLADPTGRLFGIDTKMSRGLCRDGDCPYTVLVFENFGSESWTTNPRIVKLSTHRRAAVDLTDSSVTLDNVFEPMACHEFVHASSNDEHAEEGKAHWNGISCEKRNREEDQDPESTDPFAEANDVELNVCVSASFGDPCDLRPSVGEVGGDECKSQCEEMDPLKSSLYSCQWDDDKHKCVPSDAGENIVNRHIKTHLDNERNHDIPPQERARFLTHMRESRGLPVNQQAWRAHLSIKHKDEMDKAIKDEQLQSVKAWLDWAVQRRDELTATLKEMQEGPKEESGPQGLRGNHDSEDDEPQSVESVEAQFAELTSNIKKYQRYVDQVEGNVSNDDELEASSNSSEYFRSSTGDFDLDDYDED